MDDIGMIISELLNLEYVTDAWLDPDNEGNVFNIKVEVKDDMREQLWEEWFSAY